MEHLLHTPGFTLEFLEFVVIDEADRLLSQSYQNWIPALFGPPPALGSQQQHRRGGGGVVPPFVVGEGQRGQQLRKLLFSATLTRNPSKLAPLRLRQPLYFTGRDHRYQTPKELKEFMVLHVNISYVCIYIKLYVHTHTQTHTHTHTHIICAYIYVCMYVYIYICLYV